jgi:hypothetical protein
MHDLENLLPRSKSDIARATAIVALGYPSVRPLLPDLIKWLQDYNWPVAEILAPFLASIGQPLVPEVQYILASNDTMWQYWVISCIVANSAPIFVAVKSELQRIASAETGDEDQEQLRLIAQTVLEQNS